MLNLQPLHSRTKGQKGEGYSQFPYSKYKAGSFLSPLTLGRVFAAAHQTWCWFLVFSVTRAVLDKLQICTLSMCAGYVQAATNALIRKNANLETEPFFKCSATKSII